MNKNLHDRLKDEFFLHGEASMVFHCIDGPEGENKMVFNKVDGLSIQRDKLFVLVEPNANFSEKPFAVDICGEPVFYIGKDKAIVQFDNLDLLRSYKRTMPNLNFVNERDYLQSN